MDLSSFFKMKALFLKVNLLYFTEEQIKQSEGGGEVTVFSAKCWGRRSSIVTPCHDAQVVESNRGSNPFHLTVLAAKSEDYTTVRQHVYIFKQSYLIYIYGSLTVAFLMAWMSQ